MSSAANVLSDTVLFITEHRMLPQSSTVHLVKQTFDQSHHSSLTYAQCSRFVAVPPRRVQWRPFDQCRHQLYHLCPACLLRWQLWCLRQLPSPTVRADCININITASGCLVYTWVESALFILHLCMNCRIIARDNQRLLHVDSVFLNQAN